MAGRPRASEADRAKAYVALEANNGSVKAASRDTGFPESTVRRWRDQFKTQGPPNMESVEAAIGDFSKDADRVRGKALAALEQQIDSGQAKARELITIVGVLDDKVTRARGLATSRTEHTLALPSADDLRAVLGPAVQAALDAAQRRESEIEGFIVEEVDVDDVHQIPA